MQHLLELTVQYSCTQSQWRWLCLCSLLSRCATPSTGCAFVTCWFYVSYMIQHLVHCANDHSELCQELMPDFGWIVILRSETWPVAKGLGRTLAWTEVKMVRWMFGTICWTEWQTGYRECWVGTTNELVEVVWTSAKKRGWLGKTIYRIDHRWHTWLEMVNKDLIEIWYMHSRCTLWKQLTLRVLLEGCWHLVCWRMNVWY